MNRSTIVDYAEIYERIKKDKEYKKTFSGKPSQDPLLADKPINPENYSCKNLKSIKSELVENMATNSDEDDFLQSIKKTSKIFNDLKKTTASTIIKENNLKISSACIDNTDNPNDDHKYVKTKKNHFPIKYNSDDEKYINTVNLNESSDEDLPEDEQEMDEEEMEDEQEEEMDEEDEQEEEMNEEEMDEEDEQEEEMDEEDEQEEEMDEEDEQEEEMDEEEEEEEEMDEEEEEDEEMNEEEEEDKEGQVFDPFEQVSLSKKQIKNKVCERIEKEKKKIKKVKLVKRVNNIAKKEKSIEEEDFRAVFRSIWFDKCLNQNCTIYSVLRNVNIYKKETIHLLSFLVELKNSYITKYNKVSNANKYLNYLTSHKVSLESIEPRISKDKHIEKTKNCMLSGNVLSKNSVRFVTFSLDKKEQIFLIHKDFEQLSFVLYEVFHIIHRLDALISAKSTKAPEKSKILDKWTSLFVEPNIVLTEYKRFSVLLQLLKK